MMVPKGQLTRISGFNQTLQGINSLAAPPLGAFLINLMSTQNILLIDVGTALLAIIPLFFIPIPQPKRITDTPQGARPSLLQDIREALHYIRSIPGLLTIIFMALFLNFLLVPIESLMPLLVTKHFGKGAIEFGIINSVSGAGIIAGGILLGVSGGFKKKIITSMTAIVGLGVAVLLIGVAPANLFILAIAGSIMLGFMSPLANGPLGALLQTII
jgi:DHA3 family macrolide efflux protein-like MFS transporter